MPLSAHWRNSSVDHCRDLLTGPPATSHAREAILKSNLVTTLPFINPQLPVSKLLFTVQETLMVWFCGRSHSPTWKGVGWPSAPSVALLTHDLFSLTGMLPTFSVPLILYNPDMTYAGWSQHSPTSIGSFSSRCQKKKKQSHWCLCLRLDSWDRIWINLGQTDPPALLSCDGSKLQIWQLSDLSTIYRIIRSFSVKPSLTSKSNLNTPSSMFLLYLVHTPSEHLSLICLLSIYMSVSHPGYIYLD